MPKMVAMGASTFGATRETPSVRDVLARKEGSIMATDTLVSERERLYRASTGKPEIVHVPEMSFVMIDGHGDPNTSRDYKEAIEALYALSYTLKFALKKEQGLQYRVGPLEGLWWAEDMAAFDRERKGDWNLDRDDRSA